MEVSLSVLVKTSVLAPCVVVNRTVDAGAVVSIVTDRVIVDASAVVVSLGSVEVKTIVLAPCVVVMRTVDAGKVLPGAVETRVSVWVAPAWVMVAPAIVVVRVPAASVLVTVDTKVVVAAGCTEVSVIVVPASVLVTNCVLAGKVEVAIIVLTMVVPGNR